MRTLKRHDKIDAEPRKQTEEFCDEVGHELYTGTQVLRFDCSKREYHLILSFVVCTIFVCLNS